MMMSWQSCHCNPKELNIDADEVESLVVSCILDNTIQGRIDQVNQILELDREPQGAARLVGGGHWSSLVPGLPRLSSQLGRLNPRRKPG